MYKVYAFATPNSVKVPLALEEMGLDYELHAVNVRKGEQKGDAFVAMNANAKVPVLNDATGDFVLTESAAILVYLAERHGKLLSNDMVTRARTFEQLFAHASGLSPAFGQAGYFLKFAPEVMPHAIERFSSEANRQLSLLDNVLSKRRFAAGDELSIADIAHFGWIWRRAFPDVSLAHASNVQRWYDELMARPAFVRAIDKLEALSTSSN
ncbi:glutathione S-transferase family protein [Robbsia andropogonis]|uniref:glutathione S-transferase family protein n=1 Tax=Robbsia andropogonis TaxID=28092 RepID=UPI002A6A3034|nr:glutathione binding-like protein [Robbsia andropogonis]